MGGTRDGVDSELKLNSVVPWGRSFDEYCRMFALRSVDLAGRILGCADGPASFNAELTARGGRVVSVDPLYRFSAEEIQSRIADARERVEANTRQNLHAYRWDRIPSLDALCDLRMRAMNSFLDDFVSPAAAARYVPAGLPRLPFKDDSFDLVLCSHFLFLYSTTLTPEFHVAAIREMMRVGREVRIFPLVDLNGQPCLYLNDVLSALSASGYKGAVVPVDYEFLRGANKMLSISQSH